MASPSRRRQRKRTLTVPLAVFHDMDFPAARDWAELPVDVILQVLHKLDHVDILMGAGLACRSWRAAASDEPVLWRRIDMRGFARLPWQRRRDYVSFREMAREAVRRSAGQCEAFWSKSGGDDQVLSFLAELAPSLRSLRLIRCMGVSEVGIKEIIHNCPLLETLDTPGCDDIHRNDDTLRGKELSIRAVHGWRSSSCDDDKDFIGPPSPCTCFCCWCKRDKDGDGLDEYMELLDFLEYGRYFYDIHETEFDDEQDYKMLDKGDRRYLKAEGWTWSG